MHMRLALWLGGLPAALVLMACAGSGRAQPAAPATQNTATGGAGTPFEQVPPAATATVRAAPTLAAGTTHGNTSAPTAVPIPVVSLPTPAPQATGGAPASHDVPYAAASLPGVPALPGAETGVGLEALRGKIVFFSDRAGGYAQLYVMNPDGSDQHLCNCSDALAAMVKHEVTSPDGKQFLFVRAVGDGGRRQGDVQIWTHNSHSGYEAVVTGAAPGFPGVDYDPVWSPDSRHIAWVSEASGFDEIYLYDSQTNENTRLTPSGGEWYKHPSFSPDGSLLAYWTNRENSRLRQVWLVKLDGSASHNISRNAYNDWDPIWVK